MITPLTYAAVVTGVGTAILAELALVPAGLPQRQCLLVPGAQLAWDNCDCGQFVQGIQRINPTRTFPIDSSAEPTVACVDPSMMATVFASVQRCFPTINSQGKALPCTHFLAHAYEQQYDAYALWRGALTGLCQAKTARLITAFKVGAQEFPGPEGNCKAVLITYSFQVV